MELSRETPLPKTQDSNPDKLRAIQKTALKQPTNSIYHYAEREAVAQQFATWAVDKLKRMHGRTMVNAKGEFDTSGPMLQFSLLETDATRNYIPVHEESEFWNLLHETIKLHVAAYSKAHEKTPGHPELKDSIFDLESTRGDIAEMRRSYLQELLRSAADHARKLKKVGWKTPLKLATYYAPEWLASYLDGSLITEFFEGRVDYDASPIERADHRSESKFVREPLSKERIQEFLKLLRPGRRLALVVSNIKNPFKAIERVYNNYYQQLSDESLKKYFLKKGYKEEEISSFLTEFASAYRIDTAVQNIRKPMPAVEQAYKNYHNVVSDEYITALLKAKGADDTHIATFLAKFTTGYRVGAALNRKELNETICTLFDGTKRTLDQRTYDKETGMWIRGRKKQRSYRKTAA